VNLFVAAVAVSAISNYTSANILLKLFFIVLLSLAFIVLLKKQGYGILYLFDFRKNVFLLRLLGGLEFLLLLNLVYSVNIEYGLFKLIQLNLTAFPLILILAKTLELRDEKLFEVFYISVIGWSILTFIAIAAVNPFDQSTVYRFELTRWSHVILGRFEFLLLTILLGINVTGRFKVYKKYAFAAIILLIIAISVTGLRSVMLGTFILVPLMLLIGISRKEVKKGEAALILILLIITPLAVRYFISNDTGKYRIDTLLPTNNQLLLQDASVTGRMEAYKFSVEKFLESPVIGKGLGGYYKSADSTGIQGGRYPHNILLEVLVESGIAGLLVLGYLIFLIIAKTRQMSLGVMVFFLAALYLAMFSKDIPGNSVFLLGLAFVGDSKTNQISGK